MRCAYPLLVAVAACRFSPASGAAPDAATAQVVDDTAADFAAGSSVGLVVDPLGLLVPEAYAPGGLHARAYAQVLVGPTTTWDALQAMLATATPAGEAYGVVPADWGADRPHGLGLTSSDDFTIVVDGELYLAGPTELQLAADDDAFVELDLGAIRPLLRSHVGDPAATLTVAPPHPGWYPIRGAMSDVNGSAAFALALAGAGTVPQPVTPDVLRARGDDAQGLIVSGAADRMLASLVPATSLEPTLAHDWGSNAAPGYDLGVPAQDFSLRFAGQVRIDAAGMYAFGFDVGAEPGDYARIAVDGVVVASTWPGETVTPMPVQLDTGWHDIVVDYADQSGDARLTATITPPGGTPAPLGGAVLRPVRAGGLLATVAPTTTVPWNTPGTIAIPMPLAAPPGAVVDAFAAYFQASPRAINTMFAVTSPTGAGLDGYLPASPAYENTLDAFYRDTPLAGVAVTGTWQIALSDDQSDGGGTLSSAALVVTYHGGTQAPYPTQMTYVSAPHPTPGARAITDVRVAGPANSDPLTKVALNIDLRTGDAATIATAPWVPFVPGQPTGVAAGAFVEYRLTLTGDGWHERSIDRVEIDYTTGGS